MKSPYEVRRHWIVPGLVEELDEGAEFRRGFGFAFRRWQRMNAVTALMPLHLVIAAGLALWVWFRFGIPMRLDRRCRFMARPVHEAFLEGWDRGAAAARGDMARREEAVRKLRAEALADAVRAGMSERDAWGLARDLASRLRQLVAAFEDVPCEHPRSAPTACPHYAAISEARLALRLAEIHPHLRDRQDETRTRALDA